MITMTRQKGYLLTAIAALLYVFLGIAFADNLFTGTFWDSEAIFGSTWLSYALLATIIVAGVMQASRIPAAGVDITTGKETASGQVDDPVSWKLLLGNTWFALLWMPLRLFVGQEWLSAGEHKVRADAWMSGGTALKGYWERATAIPETGTPAITYNWFRDFLTYMLDHEWYTWFAKLVAVGEVLVGLGLIFGALVGIAAFFGTVLNFNFLLAGSASTNPVLFGLGVFLVLGWKVAGYVGIDRYLLPLIGTPWQPGKATTLHQRNGTSAPRTA
jgi:thiosulfate dehydrogenase [quinone] large subunit